MPGIPEVPGAEWLDLATEADLERAERVMQEADRAEAEQPLPAEVDLFGEPTGQGISRRKMASMRNEVAYFRRKASIAGMHPMDFALHNLAYYQAKGDYEKSTPIALALLPYFCPRLSAMSVQAPAGSGGVVRFTWEAAESAPELTGPVA
jgi:hypothetical protein